MRFWSIAPYALTISSVAALLAGCGGNSGTSIPATSGGVPIAYLASKTKTFSYTGGPQVFRVPAKVYNIQVVMRGATGARGCHNLSRGARVFAVIPVTPHQKLWVYVGGMGALGRYGSSGGFNSGGNGGAGGFSNGSGGGGASDVRVTPRRRSDRILVAGGGGGNGYGSGVYTFSYCCCPGYGGGLVGGKGVEGFDYYAQAGGGGGGGSQSAGGTGGQGGGQSAPFHGYPGTNGRSGVGAAGGQPEVVFSWQ